MVPDSEVPLWREAQYVSTLDDPEEKLIAVSYQDEVAFLLSEIFATYIQIGS